MKFVFSYRGAGARVILAETCQLVHFPTPALHPISVRRQSRQRLSEFFLAAQRRTASAVKKKLPKENPWKVFSGLFRKQRGSGLSGTPGCPVRTVVPVERAHVLLSAQSSRVRQTCETRLGAKKFPLEISLRGDCLLCDEDPHPPSQPTRMDFCRAKMPCGGQVPPNLLLGSIIINYLANQ